MRLFDKVVGLRKDERRYGVLFELDRGCILDAAREAGASEDAAVFNKNLRRIAKAKTASRAKSQKMTAIGRLAVIFVLSVTLGLAPIAWADGAAKMVCVIENPPGTIIQEIDAPNGRSAGSYCAEQIEKFLRDNPTKVSASVRLGCFTQGIADWADGLHDLHSAPCQSLR